MRLTISRSAIFKLNQTGLTSFPLHICNVTLRIKVLLSPNQLVFLLDLWITAPFPSFWRNVFVLLCSWSPTWMRSSSPEPFPPWVNRWSTCASYGTRWQGKNSIHKQLSILQRCHSDVKQCVITQGCSGLLFCGNDRWGHSWEVPPQNQRETFTRSQSGMKSFYYSQQPCFFSSLILVRHDTPNLNLSPSQPTRFKLNRATFGKQDTGWVRSEQWLLIWFAHCVYLAIVCYIYVFDFIICILSFYWSSLCAYRIIVVSNS